MNDNTLKEFLLRLPKSLVKQIDDCAKKDNRSRNNFIMKILLDYLSSN